MHHFPWMKLPLLLPYPRGSWLSVLSIAFNSAVWTLHASKRPVITTSTEIGSVYFTLTRSVLAHDNRLMPSRCTSEMIYGRLRFFTTFTTRSGTASIRAIGHIDNELQGNVSRQPSSFLRMRGLGS